MRRKPRHPLPPEMRARVLAEEPRCPCGAESQVVHHLSNRGVAYKDHSRSNLRALCWRCHEWWHQHAEWWWETRPPLDWDLSMEEE